MIQSFQDKATADIFNGVSSKDARKVAFSVGSIAVRKLDMLHAAASLRDLGAPPGNRLESLKGRLRGFHSIRINDQYRIIFRWAEGHAHQVKITDYH